MSDKDTNETYIVPALYVKATSDEAEWKEIERSIRIGVDILAIVLSVASLGAGTPLLTALAVTDIALSTVDIAVAFIEEELEKTPDGQKFLDGWNKFMLAGGAITGVPAIGATITFGIRLFSRATLEASKNFLRASVLRLLLEIEIAGFVKNTLKVIEPTEIFKGADYLAGADKLWKEGVVFVEGTSTGKNAKKIYGAIYNGEVIARGTKLEITRELKDIWKLADGELIQSLEDAYWIKKIDAAVEKLGIKILVPKNLYSDIQSSARLKSIIKKLSTNKRLVFNPNKTALKELGIKLPKSKTGLSVDFAGSPYLYPVKEGERNIVKIKLTGSDYYDKKLAEELSGISRNDIKGKYTWHHLDDYDPITNTCTMQLVNTNVHRACSSHIGSVELVKQCYPNANLYLTR